jgi:hypothetical protein
MDAFTVWGYNPERVKCKIIKGLEQYYDSTKIKWQHRASVKSVNVIMIVGRPQLKPGEGYVGGKVALARVYYEKTAERSSKNRPAGTVERIDCTTSNPIFRDYVSPQLMEQMNAYPFPPNKSKYAQADNASAWKKAWPDYVDNFNNQSKFHLERIVQPGQSPMTNLNDLLTINSLKCYIRKLTGYEMIPTCDEIWDATQQAFNDMEPYKLEIAYRLWEQNLQSIVDAEGGRTKLVHSGIRKAVLKEHNAWKKKK